MKMPRGSCHRHGQTQPCTCAMGNLYRFIEPVLLFLLKKRGGAHGYELTKELGEHALTDNVVERGAVYRTLRTLEENGHVHSGWDPGEAGPARRSYQLTPRGEEHLAEWVKVLENLSISMERFVRDIRGLKK